MIILNVVVFYIPFFFQFSSVLLNLFLFVFWHIATSGAKGWRNARLSCPFCLGLVRVGEDR